MAATAAYALSVVPLALTYASGFALLWPHARRALGLLLALAVAIHAVQALGSHLCLERFRFGPFEWAWRRMGSGSAAVK